MQTIYKPGQGVWARGLSAAALVALGTYGAVQTRAWVLDYRGWNIGLPVFIFAVFAVTAFYLSNIARPAELLIETEIEMRKVTWPTVAEVFGATLVVIVVTLMMGFYLFALDYLISYGPLRLLGMTPRGCGCVGVTRQESPAGDC